MTKTTQRTADEKTGRKIDSDAPVALTGKAANLKPIRCENEAREKGRRGGVASGQARRERKALRELLEIALTMPSADGNGTRAEAIVTALVTKAECGDVRAFETLRDTLGERPAQTIDHHSSDGSLSPAVMIDLSGQSIENLVRMTREAWTPTPQD